MTAECKYNKMLILLQSYFLCVKTTNYLYIMQFICDIIKKLKNSEKILKKLFYFLLICDIIS